MAVIGELHRNPDGACMEPEAGQPRHLPWVGTLHAQRRHLQCVFNERQYESAPAIQYRAAAGRAGDGIRE